VCPEIAGRGRRRRRRGRMRALSPGGVSPVVAASPPVVAACSAPSFPAGVASPASAEPSRGTGRARRCRRRQLRSRRTCRCGPPSPAVAASDVAASPGSPFAAAAPAGIACVWWSAPGAADCGGRRRRRRRRRCGAPSTLASAPNAPGTAAAVLSAGLTSPAPESDPLPSDGAGRSLGGRSSVAVSGDASLAFRSGSSCLRWRVGRPTLAFTCGREKRARARSGQTARALLGAYRDQLAARRMRRSRTT
jgi:hypothetical protein